MIAQLRGLLAQVEADRCVIDVSGVGYLVQASSRTLAALPQPPELALVLVETVVREDAILLYGFAEASERSWFRLLTTVQGVGAKVALAILSVLPPPELMMAIGSGDKTMLTRAGGVGARLAQRIVTELRDKCEGMPTGAPAGGGVPGVTITVPTPRSIAADAVLALSGLGFRRAEAQPVVERVIDRFEGDVNLDVVIRDALKELAR
ncbi:Holliday junction branch migration protein RuvA [Komagataeibacter nataicola]|uniref:Holliday junction branch migration complex subunit RuvA n=1 Tax=Komagataeibacter nataicola TaxID=265960 RepID=A0A9N7CD04_9PROT|nr:Holliday junction branch migration protein RuvA [Komagataeibacter nataicola]AQU87294.1 Holliday junction branch migration protein RuvA [Komagataeibacter nataicola]PYD67441.1 Holliday junction branch migration protein RuvA [Komagataeibacter nataicola]WEQ55813.1 Holliday junction branch migration protein RuvA [Komagataeibacter nataicola]WNM09324.1 Holliday junction branch migration protein RuvA [Komagataeibacter nataicola]GBR14951.1 Holliday junction DNA helicase RuvA [Komagataeibacter nataic